MGFTFFRNGSIIEFVVRDDSGAKIETQKCPIKDKKKATWIMRMLKEKYGFVPEIKNERSVSFMESERNLFGSLDKRNTTKKENTEDKNDVDWFGYAFTNEENE